MSSPSPVAFDRNGRPLVRGNVVNRLDRDDNLNPWTILFDPTPKSLTLDHAKGITTGGVSPSEVEFVSEGS